VRLLLDEMYPRRLAEQLRVNEQDVVAVVELPDLVGKDDAEVVRYARENRRIVVTENVVDYAPLDAGEHAGLLLVSARQWPRTPSELPCLLQALNTLLSDRPNEPAPDVHGIVEWL
jgi:hypothetical protein